MKKRISLILVFAMLVSLIVPFTITTVSAAASAIYNQTDLAGMSATGDYYLANDITISGEWTGVNGFKGTFDGRGHTITFANGAVINGGLFKALHLKAYVHDFYIVQAGTATWNYNTGAVGSCTGSIGGVAGCASTGDSNNYNNADVARNAANKIRIENVVVTATISESATISVQEAAGIGGIVGEVNSYTEITRCIFNGSITDTCNHSGDNSNGGNSERSSYGGIAGIAFRPGALIITECINNGNITGLGNQGGILGAASPVWDSGRVFNTTIQRCVNNGTITTTGSGTLPTAGGIAGYVYTHNTTATIQNNINRGIVSKSTGYGAGIVARLRRGQDNYFKFLGNLQLSTLISGNQIIQQQDGSATVVFTKNYARGAGDSTYTQFNNYPATYSDLNSSYSGAFVLTLDEKVKLAWERIWESAGGKLPSSYFASNQISNQADLSAMSPSGSYTLVNNITLTGTWTYDLKFTGTLNGNGYTITFADGATVNGGLFRVLGIGATVQNLKIAQAGSATWNAVQTSTGNLGIYDFSCGVGAVTASIYGQDGGDSEEKRITIQNVTATANIAVTEIGNDNGIAAGGLVGQARNARVSILNCTFNGSITDSAAHSGHTGFGGMVGLFYGTIYDSSINKCTNNASITGKFNTGGIIGFAEAHTTGGNKYINLYLSECLNTGDITCQGANSHAGGIVGRAVQLIEADIYINYCINYGNVTANQSTTLAAGICGYLNNARTDHDRMRANVNYGTITVTGGTAAAILGGRTTPTAADDDNHKYNYSTTFASGNNQNVYYTKIAYPKDSADAVLLLNTKYNIYYLNDNTRVAYTRTKTGTPQTLTKYVGYQGGTKANNKRNIRIIAGYTDSDRYKADEVGLEIKILPSNANGMGYSDSSTQIYGSVVAAGVKVSAASYSSTYYLYTAVVRNVPTNLTVDIVIRPFYKLGSTTYYGDYTILQNINVNDIP